MFIFIGLQTTKWNAQFQKYLLKFFQYLNLDLNITKKVQILTNRTRGSFQHISDVISRCFPATLHAFSNITGDSFHHKTNPYKFSKYLTNFSNKNFLCKFKILIERQLVYTVTHTYIDTSYTLHILRMKDRFVEQHSCRVKQHFYEFLKTEFSDLQSRVKQR